MGNASKDYTVLNASGYVTARRVATVSSKVTGKVVEVLIQKGRQVKEGQVVARLDDTNVKASPPNHCFGVDMGDHPAK
jgi:multidrug efflux pump subunit AcrA (membrane-fusion protein)